MAKLLYGINCLTVLAMLFAYISPFIDPATTGLFSFFGLGYPFIMVINILFLFFWLAFKPKYALLPAIFLAFGFGAVKRTIGFNPATTNQDGLTIMTFNIGKTRVDFHNRNRDKKIAAFKSFINKEQPDVICLQERKTKHFKYYAQIFTDYKLYPSTDIGTAIYSKYPILNSGNIAFDTRSHNATWVDIKAKGKIFRIYSMHLSSNHVPNLTDNVKEVWDESKYILDKYNVHAVMRVEQLKRVLKHAASSPHPVIFNGDFNDVPQSYVYRIIDEKYKDAFLEKGQGLAQTFKSRFIGLRIDYTFTDESVNILDHDIIKTSISDHYPVVTTIGLGGKKP